MSTKFPFSFLFRIEREWAESIKLLRQIHGHIAGVVERALQREFNNEGSLIPVPVRTVGNRRRPDQSRSRD
jgi:hypothetical protein